MDWICHFRQYVHDWKSREEHWFGFLRFFYFLHTIITILQCRTTQHRIRTILERNRKLSVFKESYATRPPQINIAWNNGDPAWYKSNVPLLQRWEVLCSSTNHSLLTLLINAAIESYSFHRSDKMMFLDFEELLFLIGIRDSTPPRWIFQKASTLLTLF